MLNEIEQGQSAEIFCHPVSFAQNAWSPLLTFVLALKAPSNDHLG